MQSLIVKVYTLMLTLSLFTLLALYFSCLLAICEG
jgi:hypothetical protein